MLPFISGHILGHGLPHPRTSYSLSSLRWHHAGLKAWVVSRASFVFREMIWTQIRFFLSYLHQFRVSTPQITQNTNP